jgi:hypothetical protein
MSTGVTCQLWCRIAKLSGRTRSSRVRSSTDGWPSPMSLRRSLCEGSQGPDARPPRRRRPAPYIQTRPTRAVRAPERQCLHDIRAPPDPAVEEHLGLFADGLHDPGGGSAATPACHRGCCRRGCSPTRRRPPCAVRRPCRRSLRPAGRRSRGRAPSSGSRDRTAGLWRRGASRHGGTHHTSGHPGAGEWSPATARAGRWSRARGTAWRGHQFAGGSLAGNDCSPH